MNFETLDSGNYVLYAAKYYDNPHCTGIKEFKEDLNRIKYIKKLFTRYENGEDFDLQLILNHLIVLNNIFPPFILNRLLVYKLENYLHYLKPFLIFLNIYIDIVPGIGKNRKDVYMDSIYMNKNIIEKLRKL